MSSAIAKRLGEPADGWVIDDGDRLISWSELRDRAQSVIEAARDSEFLILSGTNSFETVAIIAAGAVSKKPVILVNPSQPLERIVASLRGFGGRSWVDERLHGLVLEDSPDRIARLPISELGYILFTSGSTGQPKGICIGWESISNTLTWARNTLRRSENEVIGLASPAYFDIGYFEVVYSLCFGHKIVIFPDAADYFQCADTIQDKSVTTIFSVPLFFSHLAKAWRRVSDPTASQLRVLISGGDFLDPETARFWIDYCTLVNVWGPSETSVVNAAWEISRRDIADVVAGGIPSFPIGHLSTDMDIRVESVNQSRESPIGEVGELVIYGNSVGLGYLHGTPSSGYGRNGATKFFRTGDLGFREDGGRLFIQGRSDFMVKIGGHRVDPREIEFWLQQDREINQVCVVPITVRGQTVLGVAVCVHGETKNLSLASLRNQLRGRVPAYMLPKRMVVLDKFPTNLNGKIDRKKLAYLVENHD